MATVREVVEAAFQKIGISGIGEAVDAESAAHGLSTLNAMMHGWKLRGVDISHSDVTMSDAFPLSAEYEEGTIYLLASRLSPDYEVPPSFNAESWFRGFQAAYLALPVLASPAALVYPPSRDDREGNFPGTIT